MAKTTNGTKLLDLQARRIAKARVETPHDLAVELLALVQALKPIVERLERDFLAAAKGE